MGSPESGSGRGEGLASKVAKGAAFLVMATGGVAIGNFHYQVLKDRYLYDKGTERQSALEAQETGDVRTDVGAKIKACITDYQQCETNVGNESNSATDVVDRVCQIVTVPSAHVKCVQNRLDCLNKIDSN